MICQEHDRLPEIHPAAEGKEHPGDLREGEHQHDGLQGRSPDYYHGFTGTAGK